MWLAFLGFAVGSPLATWPSLVRDPQAGAPPAAGENRVDFRYALPWWQSAICLPDDPDKALVGKEGQVLLDFGGWTPIGGFRNFKLCLRPEIVGGAKWLRQQTASPRAPVMLTWKDAAGVEVLEETFVVTPKPGQPQDPSSTARRIVVLVTLKNTSAAEVVRQPALLVDSLAPVHFSPKDGIVRIGPPAEITQITAGGGIQACQARSKGNFTVLLPPLKLPPGASRQVVFAVDRPSDKRALPLEAAEACGLRDAARRWWETSDLPFETIQGPDPGIQAMIESCVRNIWQAREIRGGKPAFHVGGASYGDPALAAAKAGKRLDHEVDLLRAQCGVDANPERSVHDRIRVVERSRDTEIAAFHVGLTHEIAAEQQARPDILGLEFEQQTMTIDWRVLAQREGESEP